MRLCCRLKQAEEQGEKLQQALHEMSKPLARYADDKDLDQHLRNQEVEGDPMLEYIRSKKTAETTKSELFCSSHTPEVYHLYILKEYK